MIKIFAYCFMIVIFGVLLYHWYNSYTKSLEHQAKKRSLEQKYNAKLSADLKHIEGLPLPSGVAVKVFYSDKEIVFLKDNQEISISLNKVVSIDSTTGANLKSEVAGGAVAGKFILGGTMGAVIGSLAATTIYIVITYKSSENERKYIILDTAYSGNFYTKIKKEFNLNCPKETEKIEL